MRRLLLSLFLLSFIYSQNEYLVTVPATSYSNWVYYSFDNHSIVSIDNPENSLDWDIGFKRNLIKKATDRGGVGGTAMQYCKSLNNPRGPNGRRGAHFP